MAKVFLDSNFVIEVIGLRRSEVDSSQLHNHQVYISPLTIHIMCYVFKRMIPDADVSNFVRQVYIVGLKEKLVNSALSGPTDDFEDNVQLHSAGMCRADYFLTHDQKLLRRKYFGSTRIVAAVSPQR